MEQEKLVVFHGLTEKQAVAFVSWYEGQGEQDAGMWSDEQEDEDQFPTYVDMSRYSTESSDKAIHLFLK